MTQSQSDPSDIQKTLGIGKSGRPARRRFGRPLLILAVLLALGGGWYLGWGPSGSGQEIRFISKPAEKTDLTVVVTATGSIEPLNVVEVSSELSGILRDVSVDFNDPVTEGQVLATLDTDKLQATVASSRAQLAAAKARVREAEATLREKKLALDRMAALVSRRTVSPQDVDTAQADYDRAAAAIDSAKADVAVADAELQVNVTNLSKASILSPISGVVLIRAAEPGQTVASSLQAPVLFTLAEDLTQMQVEVDVDEADVGQVREGQRATFSVDAYPNRVFEATIRELRYGSETIQGVVTYKAILTADNPDLLLRPGMTATSEIVVQDLRGVVTVPNAALRFSPPVQEADSGSFLDVLMPGPRRMLRPASQPAVSGPDRTLWVLKDGGPVGVSVRIGVSDGSRTQIVDGAIADGQGVIIDSETGTR